MAHLSTRQSRCGRHRAESGGGSARYIGRVGALAVALGLGLGVAGGPGLAVACAEDTTGAADSSPSGRADADADDPADPQPSPAGDPTGEVGDDESDADEQADDLTQDGGADKDDGDDEAEEPEEVIAPKSAQDRLTGSRDPTPKSAPPQNLSLSEPATSDLVASIDESVFSESGEIGQATVVQPVVSAERMGTAPEAPGVSVTELATPPANAPKPADAAPSAPVNVLTAAVGLLLSPLVAPGPSGPSESPLSWAALAAARREVARGVEAESVPTYPAESVSVAALVADTMVSSAAAPAFSSAAPLPNLLEVIGSVVNGIVSGIGNIISSVIGGFITGIQNIVNIVAGLFNTPPVARADAYSLPAGTALTTTAVAGVLSNDTDVNDNALTAQLVTGPSYGVLDFKSDGSFTYTPATGFAGADSFTYRASDGFATSGAVTVNLNVLVTENNPPVADNDSYDAVEATELTVAAGSGVLANDSDADGSTLTAQLVTGPSHGALTLNPDGSFLYAPAANFSGTDFFTYRASDGTAMSPPATVAIAVALVDGEPPVVEVGEVDQLSGVVAGQVSVPSRTGNPVTYALAAPVDPSLGSVIVNATTGAWTFTPNPQARLDANGAASLVAARMFAAAVGDDTATFVIDATDGVNTVAVPVEVPIDPAEAAITETIDLGTPGRTLLLNGDRLYVSVAGKVLVVDTTTNTLVDEIQTGGVPTAMVVVGDRLYITDSPNSGDAGSVWVVDTTTNTVLDLDPLTAAVDTIAVGKAPNAVAVSGTRLYVANANDFTATVIDTTSNTVVDTIPIGFVPFGLAVGEDRLYAVNLVHGTVTVIDTGTNTMVDVDPSTPDVDDAILIREGGYLPALALNGDFLYVTDLGANNVVVVDTTTYTVVNRIDVGSAPAAVAVSGNRVYVANAGSGTVSVIDTTTNTIVETVPVGSNPNAIVASGNHAYVVNATSNSVSVISTRAQPTV